MISESSRSIYGNWYETHSNVLNNATRLLLGGGRDLVEGTADVVNYSLNKVILDPFQRAGTQVSNLVFNVSMLTVVLAGAYLIFNYED